MELFKVEEEVKKILEIDEQARADDMHLYACYAWEMLERAGEKVGSGWLEKVFSNERYRYLFGIAPYESVSRARRKLQEVNEDLRPSEETIRARKEKIKEYKQYAKSYWKGFKGNI